MPTRSRFAPRALTLSALAATAALAGCVDLQSTGPQADYFSSRALARIYALDDGSFEVVPEIGAQGAAYWCAASEYARRRLGADWSQDIYVAKGRAPSTVSGRIDSVTFTLSHVPSAEGKRPFINTFGFKPGDNFSVSSGDSFCRDLEPLFFF
ncbi:hypothetical protein [Tritonibacter mobilis]|uniref:hypothetical protein n=1 Tax=Tritonibacter mobilis TaxID=379347 RepID=UPI001C0870D3|nr:hypothetical protein [Tritonibacter mobilis]MBU3036385.1 hypothetical protein [Tritonibacter mobilis]WHQ83136.1 hypothetical protein OMR53_03250 [Tritonibacter mobilis]